MKIGIVDVDGHNFPNLALMKLSAWHKANGDDVKLYEPLFDHPDKIYASKIFTFTPDYPYFPRDCDICKGGTGYDVKSKLPSEIEEMQPDYSLYPQYDFAVGFLTRGCPNHCPWCVVPDKEGKIHVVNDIAKIATRRTVKLLDNNFLAADESFVTDQLKKMAKGKWRIDFNQALDCRRVTTQIAALLSKVKWERYIRFSCDTDQAIEPMYFTVRYLREAGYKAEIFVYCLAKDVDNTLKRIEAMAHIGATPFCMPYRDLNNNHYEVPHELKRLARWCNIQSIRKSIPFSKYNG